MPLVFAVVVLQRLVFKPMSFVPALGVLALQPHRHVKDKMGRCKGGAHSFDFSHMRCCFDAVTDM